MKKITVSFLLLACLCMLVAGGSAYSEIGVNNAVIPPGSTEIVSVYVSGLNAAEGLNFNLTFDKDLLRVDGVLANSAIPGSAVYPNMNNESGFVNVAVTNGDGITVEDSVHTSVVDIYFTAIGDSGETTEVTFDNSSIEYSKEFDPVSFDSVGNSQVEIRDKRTIIAPSGTLGSGLTGTFPLSVANITGADYIRVSLVYDSRYVSITDFAPAQSGIIINEAHAGNGVYSFEELNENDVDDIPEEFLNIDQSYFYENWAEFTVIIPGGIGSAVPEDVVDIEFQPTDLMGTANISYHYGTYYEDAEGYKDFDVFVPGQITTVGGGKSLGGDVKAPAGNLEVGSVGTFPLQIKDFTGNSGCYITTEWNSSVISSESVVLNSTAATAGVTIDSFNPSEGRYYANIGNLSGLDTTSWTSLLDFRLSSVATSGESPFNVTYGESWFKPRDNVTISNYFSSVENGVITLKESEKPDLVGYLIDPAKYVKKFKNGSISLDQTMVIENIGNSAVTENFKIQGQFESDTATITISDDISPGDNITYFMNLNVIPDYPDTDILLAGSEDYKRWYQVKTGGNVGLGDYGIGLHIDVDNDVDEINEENNYVNTTAQITHPDLVPIAEMTLVSGISSSNTTIVDEVSAIPGTYQLTYGVNNTGNVYAFPTKLNLTRGGTSTIIDIPRLDPGENWTSSMNIDVGRAFTDYRIEVNSDRSEAETNYDNNVYEESIGSYSPVTVILPHIGDGSTSYDSEVQIWLTNVSTTLTSFKIALTYDQTVCINSSPVTAEISGVTSTSSYGRFVITGSDVSVNGNTKVATIQMRARSDDGRTSVLGSQTSSYVKTTENEKEYYVELEIHEGSFEQVDQTDAYVSLFTSSTGSVDHNQSVSVTVRNRRSNPVTLTANLTANDNLVWELTGINLSAYQSKTYSVGTWQPSSGGSYKVNASISGDDVSTGNLATKEVTIKDYELDVTESNKLYWNNYYGYNKSVVRDEYLSIGTYFTANQAGKVNSTLSIFYPDGTEVDLDDDSVFDLYYYYPAERQIYGYNSKWNWANWYYVTPKQLGTFNYTISLEARGKSTSVNGTIEVREPNVDIKVLNTTMLIDESSKTLAFDVFKRNNSGSQDVNILLAAGAEGRTIQGLDSIIGYPHGCPEQTMSPALIALRVKQYYESRGALTDDINATVQKTMQKSLDRMNPPNGYNAQQLAGESYGDQSGGWAWGKNSRPSMFYTLYPNYVITEMLNDNDPDFWNVEDNMSNINLSASADWLINHQNDAGYWQAWGYISNDLEWTGYISEKLVSEHKYLNSDIQLKSNTSLDKAYGWLINYSYSSSDNTQPLAYAVYGLAAIRENGIGDPALINSKIQEIAGIIEGQKQASGASEYYWQNGRYSWNKYEPTAHAIMALNVSGYGEDNATITGGAGYLVGKRAGRSYSGGWGSTRSSAAVVNTLTQVVPASNFDFTVNAQIKNSAGTVVWSQNGISFDSNNFEFKDSLDAAELQTLYYSGLYNGTATLTVSNKVDSGLDVGKLSFSVDSFEQVPETLAIATIPEEFIDPIATDFSFSINVPNSGYDLKEGDERDVQFTVNNNLADPIDRGVMIIEVPISNEVNFTGSAAGQDTVYYLDGMTQVFISHMYNATESKLYAYPGSDDESQPSVDAGEAKTFYIPLKFGASGNVTVEGRTYPMYEDTWMALGSGNTYVKGYGNVNLTAVDENNNAVSADYYIDGSSVGIGTSVDESLLEGTYAVGIHNASTWINTTIEVEPSETVSYTAHFASDTTVPFVSQAEGAVDEVQVMAPTVQDTTSNSSVSHWNAVVVSMKTFNSSIVSSGGTATISVDIPTVTRAIGTVKINETVLVMVHNASGWFTMPESGYALNGGGMLTVFNLDTSDVDQIYIGFDGRKLGDVDEGGIPNVIDALLIARKTVGTYTFTGNAEFYGDVNDDGVTNVIDALMIARYTVGTVDENYQVV